MPAAYEYVDDKQPFWRAPGMRNGHFVLVQMDTGLQMTGYVLRTLIEEPTGYLGLAVHEFAWLGSEDVCFGWWLTIPAPHILFIHRLMEMRPESCKCSIAHVLSEAAEDES